MSQYPPNTRVKLLGTNRIYTVARLHPQPIWSSNFEGRQDYYELRSPKGKTAFWLPEQLEAA